MRLFWLLLLSAGIVGPSIADTHPDPQELLERMDTLYQQDASEAVMTMHILTPNYERTLKMEAWALGHDYALVRVLEPLRERGVSTLKRGDDMWNYLPRINRTVRVPPSMLMDSWMGSDFTNDDLMRDTSWVDHYDVTMTSDDGYHVLTLTPLEDTVTVWGQMVITVRQSDLLPVTHEYFNEQGELMRVMEFDDVREFDGISLPARLTLRPTNKEGQRTTVQYESLSFDVDLSESFFTLQNLRR